MIISRTPVRISFFGGGTDYPNYYEKHGGKIISTSINQYTYITLTKLSQFFEHTYRISYSKTELAASIEEIIHPAVKACLQYTDCADGIEINIISNLPARTGLGSSSSFTVGLLNCLYTMQGLTVSSQKLAEDAIFVEQELIGERVGSQDQIAAAHGGLAKVTFDNHGYLHQEIVLPEQRKRQLRQHICLFYTGIRRFAHEVLKEQIDRTELNLEHLELMKDYVDQAEDILLNGNDLLDFGQLLHENWQLKQKLSSKISSREIDTIYQQGLKHGAVGGKLLGAGGGGFILFFVPIEIRQCFIEKMKPLLYTPVQFDDTGTQVIFNQD